MKRRGTIVLVFGTFDGLHEGHRFFLREAHKLGNWLVAVVAQDKVAQALKGKPPREPLVKRLAALRAGGPADEVVSGDSKLGAWSALKQFKPNVIALGYDQTELEKELREFISKENLPITIQKIAPLDGDRLHSRLLHKK